MKKKMFAAVVGLGLVALVAGCGGKYSDVVETNRELIKVMKAYVDDITAAGSAADAARAVNRLADGMEKLAPKMKAMKKKHPELQHPGTQPKELKVNEKEMAEVSQKFGESFMKLMTYMENKEVQDAQARLTSIMRSMGQE